MATTNQERNLSGTHGASTHSRTEDQRAVASMAGVLHVSRNTTSWYNNASFLLPLTASILACVAGLITRRGDFLGFAAFLAVVTALMTPVVLAAWRHTPTAVVVTTSGIVGLHDGRVLKALRWSDVRSVRERETQGNRRWEIASQDGERLLLDGELEGLAELVQLSLSLAARSLALRHEETAGS